MLSAVIIGKAIQSKSDQIFEAIGGSVRKEERIVYTLVKDSEPA
jgi:hypothetical protein